jgi:hypothetical protein
MKTLIYLLYEDAVRTSQKTQGAAISTSIRWILCKEVIVVYCADITETDL